MAFATLAFALVAVAAGHSHDGMTYRQAIWDKDQCSSRPSTGPAHWEVEIQLSGLPASTSDTPVHLNWWTARQSPSPYNPLVTPVNCSVYSSMIYAYPSYDATDFNGGNVQVSASGEATIRVASPATYFVWRWVAIPHIHLRYCMGTGGSLSSRTVGLVMAGPDRWISPADTGINIVGSSYRKSDVQVNTTATVIPRAIIVGVSGGSFDTTTTAAPTTMSPDAREVLLQTARDSLDVRALTFSPVYACLLEGKFFDHFSSDCTTHCPANSVVEHGQCVRAPTVEAAADFTQKWQLSLQCDQACWNNAKTVALHNMRLAVAGHLDIPFQEVKVSFGFETSRRLQAAATQAVMTVNVQSNRLTTTEGMDLLGSFDQTAGDFSTVLGLNVLTVTKGAQGPVANEDTMDDSNDPYVPAYNDVEGNVRVPPPTTSVLDGLPTEAIIGIAAGVVLLGLIFLIYVMVRRRRQRKAQEQAAVAAKTQAKTQEDSVIGNTAAQNA